MPTKADTSVKWFTSDMANGPVLRGEVGAMIELLDACLINGFDPRTINTLVVASGVATATLSGGHAFEINAVLEISGVTGPLIALNDEWRIGNVVGNDVTFACPGISDGSATGTITAKRAGAGWVKAYADTNKAAYRSGNVTATQMLLRVDDADARYSRVRGYESMSAIDAGADPFPTLAQHAETAFSWAKSETASAAARKWVLISDGRMIHFLPAWYAPNANTAGMHEYLRFGDFPSYTPNDPYACCIAALPTATPSFNGGTGMNTEVSVANAGGCYSARALTGASGSVQHIHVSAVTSAGYGPASTSPDHLVPLYVLDGTSKTTSPLRGSVPAAFLVYGKKGSDVGYLHDVTATSDFLYVRTGRADQSANFAFMCFDVLGPWQ